ncbi:hypothetical protein LF1_48260 [Rubripirellula obstinata]|uniref:DUF1571 domain-containing protein n=1 Tax=Rubripirellula obstinata TaxID=406547 RepID=A0A5B1CSA1_9BACT|nr:DUF1571 domain-containing protein [Rubripirellula obstinata]KAA1262263.1 hypothetical protein LF1_48260 [Rubripirellula obstinata]
MNFSDMDFDQSSNQPRTRFITVKRVAMAGFLLASVAAVFVWNSGAAADREREASVVAAIDSKSLAEDEIQSLTMADVIERARNIRQAMSESLHDYTATFVKQERDASGVLGEETAMQMKVQTPFRAEDGQAAKRVFLRFVAPKSQAGRKVIWGEDIYDGKMAVHEVGMLLSLKTIWLDPTGMLAMQGQRYPISEIGMIKLIEKLIERGQQDLGNPDLKITLKQQHDFGGTEAELLQVVRSRPSNGENDFSMAEIVLDPNRQLILQYRSFGWPDSDSESSDSESSDSESPDSESSGAEAPLLESYTYKDVEVNVGLADIDFDVKNPEYGYPAF